MASILIAKSGKRQFIELRKKLAEYVYSQTFAELLAWADDESETSVTRAVESIVIDMLGSDRGVELVGSVVDGLFVEHADRTVGQWVDSVGSTGRPDVDG